MKLILSLLLCSTLAVVAQVPPVLRTPFTTNTPNANQFSGNAIKDGALTTNLNARSLTVANGIAVDGGWLSDDSLVRVDGTGNFQSVIIGSGITFDGTTLSANGGVYYGPFTNLALIDSMNWTNVDDIAFWDSTGNANHQQQWHFGDDGGSTYSWQWTIDTNQFYFQKRVGGVSEIPFRIWRNGYVDVGVPGKGVTNGGSLYVTDNVGIGTTTPAANLDVPGVIRVGTLFATNSNSSVYYNVTNYGAVGDGVTDDFWAISNALSVARAARGGVVFFPAGTYLISQTLFPTSSVTMLGVAGASIITKPASVRCNLTNSYAAGVTEITVSNTAGFTVGGPIYIADTTSFEFLSTHATITAINGNTITFTPALVGSVQTGRTPVITTSFSLIRNAADATTNIVIRDLVLDHNWNDADPTNEFTIGTIHWEGTFLSTVDNVTIRNVPSDAYSDQATNGTPPFAVSTNNIRRTANAFLNSRILNSGRHGVHLGTGQEGAYVFNNYINGCRNFGMFYCAFATFSIASQNILINCGSGFAGIDNRDYGNTISDNIVLYCNGTAIDANSGSADGTGGRLIIKNNQLHFFKTSSGAGMIINQPDCIIEGNQITSTNAGIPIQLNTHANRTRVANNVMVGPAAAGSKGMTITSTEDCTLMGNSLRGFATMAELNGVSRLIGRDNTLLDSTSTYLRFDGARSTNVYWNDLNTAATPAFTNVPPLRFVYNGLGFNGADDPATAGEWNGITARFYSGQMVGWTNTTETNLSMFFHNGTGGSWLKLSP